MVTPDVRSLFQVFSHERDGRRMYSTLREYPQRLLRQLEVLGSEVDTIRAELAKQRARAAGIGKRGRRRG